MRVTDMSARPTLAAKCSGAIVCLSAMALSSLIGILSITVSTLAYAGQFNHVLNVGDAAPAWNGLEGTDGKKHDYDELASAKFVIVAFTCNSCPYAVDVEDRLIDLSRKAAQLGGALVAINVNTIEADALPAMKDKAKTKRFDFTYLYDPTQEIAKAYGAKTTPEFYLLDADRKVIYMGSLDDSPDGTKVKERYLETAIGDLLSDAQPEVSETVPIGCRIRFARTARTRSKATQPSAKP